MSAGLADLPSPRTPTRPFVAVLRTGPNLLRLAGTGPTATLRVEMPEVWDTVQVETPLSVSVRTLKERALRALYPDASFPEEFVMKLRGFEVRNENVTAADAGALDGSIFLLTYRRRRPVRT